MSDQATTAPTTELEPAPTDATEETEEASVDATQTAAEAAENSTAPEADLESIVITPEIVELRHSPLTDAHAQSRTRIDFLAAKAESENLARNIAKLTALDADFLRQYFECKKKQGLFDFAEANELVESIQKVENGLIGKLEGQLSQNFPDLDAKAKEEAIISIREVLYSLVLNDTLDADAILSLVAGGIVIKPRPGEETAGFNPNGSQNADLLASFKTVGGKSTIYLYEGFLTNKSIDQSFLVRHELGHLLGPQIFGKEEYLDFLDAAENPTEENIAKLSSPQLHEIIKILASPEEYSLFFRDYLANKLDGLKEITDPAKLASARKRTADEMVTDLVACYLESGKLESEFIHARMRQLDQEKVIKYCYQKLGANSEEEFLAKVGATAEDDKDAVWKKIVSRPELATIFASSEDWFTEISDRFTKVTKDGFAKMNNSLDEDIEGNSEDPSTWVREQDRLFGVGVPGVPRPRTSSTWEDSPDRPVDYTKNVINPITYLWSLLTGIPEKKQQG